MKLNDIRIDNQYNKDVNQILSDIVFKDTNIKNKIYFKNLLNKVIKYYSG